MNVLDILTKAIRWQVRLNLHLPDAWLFLDWRVTATLREPLEDVP